MIALATATVPKPCGAASSLRAFIGDPLTGPGRHRDPAAAMAADVAEIVAHHGGVDEATLRQRGWTMGEIAEYLPGAIAAVRGGEAVVDL